MHPWVVEHAVDEEQILTNGISMEAEEVLA